MKAVLIAIRPEWARKIFLGEKTLEIRKNMPQDISCPFRCYVYVSDQNTHDPKKIIEVFQEETGTLYRANGRVAAEFICRRIDVIPKTGFMGSHEPARYLLDKDFLDRCCLSYAQIEDYMQGGAIHAWHISDLHLFPAPMMLNEFFRYGKCPQYHGSGCTNPPGNCDAIFGSEECGKRVQRAPQSWCYVEGFL